MLIQREPPLSLRAPSVPKVLLLRSGTPWAAFVRYVAVIGLFVCVLFPTLPMYAADTPAAHVIQVPLPIVGDVDQTVRRQINRIVAQDSAKPVAAERPLLILEFAPTPERDATGSEFERSMALARFLASPDLQQHRIVAWLPQPVSGHAVLAILACEEIVIHPDASLGAAGQHESKPSAAMKAFYAEIADQRRTIPIPVAMAMLDRRDKILKAQTPNGVRYLPAEELEALNEETNVQSIETLSEAGDLLTIAGNDLRLKFGFASHLANDRRDLAAKLALPLSSLDAHPTLNAENADWRSVRVDLIGPLNANSVDRVMRMIDNQILAKKNLICFWIDCPGGDVEQAIRLAGHISRLDPGVVHTIGYVQHQALSDASLVALACDDLVMGEEAMLGGPGAVVPSAEMLANIRPPWKMICKDQSMRWSLPLALVDDEMAVYRYQLNGAQVVEYLSPEEREELPDPDRWEQAEVITAVGDSLQLSGRQSAEFGLARATVEDYAALKRFYSLENDPTLVEPSWADGFVEELARPQIATMLLFFAFFALMVEVSSPGVGAGGFVSALCFVVYFWSQYSHGTAGMLEVLLFMLGLAFIAIEIFVLPGMGLFGVGGAALVISSLVLASQTFVLPQNAYQVQQLPRSLLTVVGGIGGLFVGLFVLRKFLHRAPVLNRVMLRPPEGEQRDELIRREALVDYRHLLHQTGVAATRLVPSGKARFGNELLNVVTEGQAVDRGGAIEVVEVQGNRVVVRPMTGGDG